MSARTVVIAALVGGILAPAAGGQTPKTDPAELFPADTLAYVELTRPAEFAPQLAAILKGSHLDNMPAFMVKQRDQKDDFFGGEMIGVFGGFFSPELLAEARRLGGGAVALTGIGNSGDPEVVGVLLAGESNLPGFLMRAFLTSYPFLGSGGRIEGVDLFVQKDFNRVFRPAGAAAPPPPAELDGTTFAYLPGAVVIGSNKKCVGDLIRRLKGKSASPNLAGSAAFREAAAARRRPGLFAYADTAALFAKFDVPGEGQKEAVGSFAWNFLKELAGPKSLRTVSASLSFADGAIDLAVQAQPVPGAAGPLLELLSDRPVDTQALAAVPRGTGLTATVSLADGERRWQKALAVADAAAKASGQIGALPSDVVKGIETLLNVRFGKDVFGRVAAVTVAMTPQDLPKGGVALPLVLLRATDPESAKALEALVPAFVGLAGGEKPEPLAETIQGKRVLTVPGTGLPWRTALNYGREGATLVIGQDRKVVAAALAADPKQGLLADEKTAAAVGGRGNAVALGVWNIAATLEEMFAEAKTAGAKPKPPATKVPAKPTPDASADVRKGLVEAARSLPPLVVAVTRSDGRLTVAVRQGGAAGAGAKVIDRLVEWGIAAGREASATFVTTPAVIEKD